MKTFRNTLNGLRSKNPTDEAEDIFNKIVSTLIKNLSSNQLSNTKNDILGPHINIANTIVPTCCNEVAILGKYITYTAINEAGDYDCNYYTVDDFGTAVREYFCNVMDSTIKELFPDRPNRDFSISDINLLNNDDEYDISIWWDNKDCLDDMGGLLIGCVLRIPCMKSRYLSKEYCSTAIIGIQLTIIDPIKE